MNQLPRMPNAFRSAHRRGISVVALVLALATVFCLLGLAIDVGYLVQRHQQLKTAGEAAALAAAQELFSSRLELDEIEPLDRATAGRQAALAFAAANRVSGRRLTLSANALNKVNGDIVLGWVDLPELGGQFDAEISDDGPVNAVMVRTRHAHTGAFSPALLICQTAGIGGNKLFTESIAAVDRRVAGFRPVGCTNIPILPILANDLDWDAAVPGRNRESETGDGGPNRPPDRQSVLDRHTVDPKACLVGAGSDSIAELQVVLERGPNGEVSAEDDGTGPLADGRRGPPRGIRANLMALGGDDQILEQIEHGLNRHHLAQHNGEFWLGSTVPVFSRENVPDLATIHAAVQRAIGQPRVLPLGVAHPGRNATVRDFVAGVVVESQMSAGSLTISIQPVIMNSCTAIVRGGADPNPWVGKVVLIR